MTPQEIFNAITNHLRNGTGQAGDTIDGDFYCRYKDKNGNKCAVGHILPEDSPEELWNYISGLNDMILNRTEIIPQYVKDNESLLRKLQITHDTSRNWDMNQFIGESALEKVAESFDLEYTPPNVDKNKSL